VTKAAIALPGHFFRRALLAGLAAACALFSIPGSAVEDRELAKYWTADADRVPYRAIVTPGREHSELLPLIVFLHGDWQDGTNNESQLVGYGNGSLELVDRALDGNIPLVYIAPQTTDAYWPPQRVADVVADAMTRFPIDPQRIYVTGISDGGTGVWDALKTWPQCFAAGVPMSGMTELAGLAPIAGVPQWIFHGGQDNDTDVESGYGGAMVGSRAVVRALRASGGRPIYTEYPDGMHPIWDRAYATGGLLTWLLSQRLHSAPCDFNASQYGTLAKRLESRPLTRLP
jgi:predicted peptidase